MPALDFEAMEDTLLARLQNAVDDGYLAQAMTIGDEAEASQIARLPAAALLGRRAGFERPKAIDIVRQDGVIEWSFYAAGEGLRTSGKRGSRRGKRGAYHAVNVIVQYMVGFEIVDGCPLWLASIELTQLNQKTGKSVYEIGLQHEWNLVQDGFEE